MRRLEKVCCYPGTCLQALAEALLRRQRYVSQHPQEAASGAPGTSSPATTREGAAAAGLAMGGTGAMGGDGAGALPPAMPLLPGELSGALRQLVNARSFCGETPLHVAAFQGRDECVGWLLRNVGASSHMSWTCTKPIDVQASVPGDAGPLNPRILQWVLGLAVGLLVLREQQAVWYYAQGGYAPPQWLGGCSATTI
jgi:hypothetical protein